MSPRAPYVVRPPRRERGHGHEIEKFERIPPARGGRASEEQGQRPSGRREVHEIDLTPKDERRDHRKASPAKQSAKRRSLAGFARPKAREGKHSDERQPERREVGFRP